MNIMPVITELREILINFLNIKFKYEKSK